LSIALLVALFVVAATIVWAGLRVARELALRREEIARGRSLRLLELFAPAAADTDPRLLVAWHPLAAAARRLFAAEFAALDAAAGSAFPFSKERIEAAHARWTADWLAWERNHDADYRLRAAAVEHESAASGGAPLFRARLEAIEREKLDLYQRRYEEYIRTAKALQTLASPDRPS
jgi:hypothetical protein